MEQKLVVLATVVLPSLLLRVSVGVYKNILCVIVYILLIKNLLPKWLQITEFCIHAIEGLERIT